MTPPIRLSHPDEAVDPAALERITGGISRISRTPLRTSGYTGARHELVELTALDGRLRRLVVKRVRLSTDWMAQRTDDRVGREAVLLAEPALSTVWEPLACPYLAFAAVDDEIALVMEDLSPYLLPDVRTPLHADEEETLLAALAALHARFWSSPALDASWLTSIDRKVGLIDAPSAASGSALERLPPDLREMIERGWVAARTRMPAAVERELLRPAGDVTAGWRDLPRTLLHGDVKVANFALLPGGRVAAFDWAMIGAGPATVDLGWYLAVNASRLARPGDEIASHYRLLLERARSETLPDSLWVSLLRVAVICGARMLLWSKALALESDRPGARAEWDWWMDHLTDALDFG